MDNNAKYYKKISTTEFTNGKLAIQETVENSTEHKIRIGDIHLVCIKDIEVVKEFFFTEEEVEKVKKFFYDAIKNKKLFIEFFTYNLIKTINEGLLEAGKSKEYINSLNGFNPPVMPSDYYIQNIKEEIPQDAHTLKRYRLKYPPSTLSFSCSMPNFGKIWIYKDDEDWFWVEINFKNLLLHHQHFKCDGFLGLKKMIENLPL